MLKSSIKRRTISVVVVITMMICMLSIGLSSLAEQSKEPVNIANQKHLVPTVYSIPHAFSWADTYPANYTYSQMNVISSYVGSGETYLSRLTDGSPDKGTHADQLGYVSNQEQNSKQNRWGILYDLGELYTLDNVKLLIPSVGLNARYFIHNYSVYAGTKPDASLLKNCVGHGGGAWDSTKGTTAETTDLTSLSYEAKVDTTAPCRYVLIVMDRMGTDANNAQYAAGSDSAGLPGYDGSSAPNIGSIYLSEIEIYGVASDEVNIAGTKNLVPTVYHVAHTLDWSKSYPSEYQYSHMTKMNTFNGSNERLNALTDGSPDKGTHADQLGYVNNQEQNSKDGRWGILYDLGGYYNLDYVNVMIPQVGIDARYYIHNYSVYAGNDANESILKNCVGHGGDAWDEENGKEAASPNTNSLCYDGKVSSDESYQYIMIVFDRMGTDPENAQYSGGADAKGLPGYDGALASNIGSVYVSEIEIFGSPSNEPAVSNIAGEKKLSPSIFQLPHQFNWSDNYPQNYSYTSMKSVSKAIGLDSVAAWTDGSPDRGKSADQIALYSPTEEATEKLNYLETKSKENRWGILYDLGGYYKLKDVNLMIPQVGISAGYYIHNYSVYAGNEDDASILSNCVGHGGGAWDSQNNTVAQNIDLTSIQYKASITSQESYRFVMIVLDRMGTDPNNANYALGDKDESALPGYSDDSPSNVGSFYLSEIQIDGWFRQELPVEKPSILKELNESQKLDGEMYTIQHRFDKTRDYSSVTYDSMTPTNFNLIHCANYKGVNIYPLNWIDGASTTDSYFDVPMLAYGRRIGLMYNLNGVYRLSDVQLNGMGITSEANFNLKNVSVYGSKTKENMLDASNLLGRGGDGTEAKDITANLNEDKEVQYVLIVFDRVVNDDLITGTESKGYAGAIGLKEIKLHGEKTDELADTTKKPENLLKSLNEKGTLKSHIWRIYRNFTWNEPYPSAYDYSVDADIADVTQDMTKELNGGIKLTDEDATTGGGGMWGHSSEWRWAIMFDLGDWYNLSDAYLENHFNCLRDGTYNYNFSIYGGSSPDQSVFDNLMGRGGEAWDSKTGKVLTKDEFEQTGHNCHFDSKLDSKFGAVRYVVFVCDRSGADVGNSSADIDPNTENGLPGYPSAPGGMFVSDFAVFGTKGTNPTKDFNYVDSSTGVHVDVITYNNNTPISSIKVQLQKPSKDEKETLLSIDDDLGEMYALNNSVYQITYYDGSGKEIHDMDGRIVKISIPQNTDDGVILYQIDTNGGFHPLEENQNTTCAIDGKPYYLYTGIGSKAYSRFVISSFTEDDSATNDLDNTTDGNNRTDTSNNDSQNSADTGEKAKPVMAVILASILTMLVFAGSKKKKLSSKE